MASEGRSPRVCGQEIFGLVQRWRIVTLSNTTPYSCRPVGPGARVFRRNDLGSHPRGKCVPYTTGRAGLSGRREVGVTLCERWFSVSIARVRIHVCGVHDTKPLRQEEKCPTLREYRVDEIRCSKIFTTDGGGYKLRSGCLGLVPVVSTQGCGRDYERHPTPV